MNQQVLQKSCVYGPAKQPFILQHIYLPGTSEPNVWNVISEPNNDLDHDFNNDPDPKSDPESNNDPDLNPYNYPDPDRTGLSRENSTSRLEQESEDELIRDFQWIFNTASSTDYPSTLKTFCQMASASCCRQMKATS